MVTDAKLDTRAGASEVVELREGRPDDIRFLMHVEEECFGGERFSEDEVLTLIRMNGVHMMILDDVGSVGYAIAEGRARLITIAVLPSHRGQGHAEEMLGHALGEARSAGCLTMTLEVAIDNLIAINLYLREGFRIDGMIPDYYGEGRDAFHMSIII